MKQGPIHEQARLRGAAMIKLEVCVDSVESSVAAARGGAERIELCTALSEGGITPSAGLIGLVRESVAIELFVIIRPRGGEFVYSGPELEVMRRDIISAKKHGADGVVLGVLDAHGAVDGPRTRELIDLARPMQVTFHRAFDASRNLAEALEDVISCGADRVLTSGGPSAAMHNLDTLASLQRQAAGRIRIMAGGGIRVGNVREIALRTGIHEIHSSLSTKLRSPVDEGGLDRGSGCYVVKEGDVLAFKSALYELATRG